MAVALQLGHPVPPRVKIDTMVIDAANIDKPDIKDRLKYYFN
jgi:hypothetical protein